MRLKSFLVGVMLFCAVSSFGQTATASRLDSSLLMAMNKVDLLTFYTPPKSKVDSFFGVWRGQLAALSYSSDVVYGNVSAPVVLQSNKVYSGLVIDLKNSASVGITGNNVSNVHITNCKIINTASFAILLNGCSNVVIDNCFISNVGFGVYAQSGSKQIKVNNNQFLNVNGIDAKLFGHAVQFNGVNGGGNQINNNRIENIAGVALHPHDGINLYKCNGLQGDSIQVIGNLIRGGQLVLWPDAYSGAAGIILGDVSGSYQVARNNVLVNPGAAGIQSPSPANGIKIDHNLIFGVKTAISSNAIIVLNPIQIEVSYNRTNWTNKNGVNAMLPDGETQCYLGHAPAPTPIGFNTNKWVDSGIDARILPSQIITMR